MFRGFVMIMYDYKISVILVTSNASKSIAGLINSIALQDFKDFELIVIDDASQDDTLKIIRENLRGSGINYRIYLNKEPKGLEFSRNYGIGLSKGRYLVFVEDDGMLYFYHLSRLWGPLNPDRNSESLKNTRIDLSALDAGVDFEKLDDEFDLNSKENSISQDDVDSVFIKGLTLDSKDEFVGFDSCNFDSILNLARRNNHNVNSLSLLNLISLNDLPFSLNYMIYDREILDRHDIHFREDYSYFADLDFAVRYLLYCNKIRFINTYTYYEYIDMENMTFQDVLNPLHHLDELDGIASYLNELSSKNSDFAVLSNQLETRYVPKLVYERINTLIDYNYPKDEIIKVIKSLDLNSRLSKFKSMDKSDYKFKAQINLIVHNFSLYHSMRKRFKRDNTKTNKEYLDLLKI